MISSSRAQIVAHFATLREKKKLIYCTFRYSNPLQRRFPFQSSESLISLATASGSILQPVDWPIC